MNAYIMAIEAPMLDLRTTPTREASRVAVLDLSGPSTQGLSEPLDR
jgi:hypothetical protein